jgi:hypothetical protein
VVLDVIEGVVNVLVLAPACECNSRPPVGESYQLNIPVDAVDALRVAVGFPQVDPFVTVTTGGGEMVAVTAARPLVQLPLSNST